MSRRTAVWVAAGLTVIVAVALVSLWVLLFTGLGTRLVLGQLRRRLAPAVTIEAIQGTLRGPLEIHGIRYQGDAVSAVVDTVRLNWRLSRLLRRKLDVELAEVAGVTLVMRAPAEDQATAVLPGGAQQTVLRDFALPVDVLLPHAVVYRIAVNRFNDSTITSFDSLTVSLATRGDSVAVERADLHGPDLRAGLDGGVQTSGSYPMRLEYGWSLIVRGMTVAGRGRLSGDLEHLELWQETFEPVRSEVAAELDSALTARTFMTSVIVADFDLSDIDSTTIAARVGGELRAEGTLSQFTGNANLRVEHASVGVATPRLSITRSGETFYLDSLEVSFRESPARLAGSGKLGMAEERLAFDGVLSWVQLGWPFLEQPRVASEGRVRAVGVLDAYALEAETRFTGGSIPGGSIVATGRGSRDSLVVRASGAGLGGHFVLQGSLQLRPLIGWLVALDADSIDLAGLLPDAASWVRDVSVSTRSEGSRINGGFEGGVQVTRLSGVLQGAPFSASAGAQLVAEGLRLDSARAELLDGEIRAEGTVSWQPQVQWRIATQVTDINPASLMPDSTEWIGSLSAAATIEGRRSPDGLEVRVEIDTVAGALRGETLSATGALAIVDSTYRLDSLALEWGTIDLHATGEIGEMVSGRVGLQAPDLSVAVPGAEGSLRADVTVDGLRSAPRLSGNIEVSRLFYRDYALERLVGAGGFDFGSDGQFDFALGGRGLVQRNRTIDTLGVSVAGVREDHEIAALLAAGSSSVRLAAAGGLNDVTWTGELVALELEDSTAGNWRLRESSEMLVGRDSAGVAQPICLVSEGAGMCAAGSWKSAGTWGVTARASEIPLDRLGALFPQSLEVVGTLDGDAEFHTSQDGALEGDARLVTNRGQIHYTIAGNVQTLTHDSGSVVIAVGGDGVHTSVAVVLENVGPDTSTFAAVEGYLDLPSFRPLVDSLLPQQLDGRLRMMASDLSAAEALYPELVSVAGSLVADLTVSGTVREPRIFGEATLEDGSADIPWLGLELRNAAWSAVGEGAEGIRLAGSAESGTGRLEIEGRMRLGAGNDSTLRVHIGGDRVLAVNTAEVQLWASPDLNVAVMGREVSVEGDVTIPRAQIELREIPALAIPVSRDAIIVSDTGQGYAPAIDIRARVRVLLGDSISFRGFGITGRPTGSLLVIDQPGQATVATGQLTIADGKYRAYGQDLTIETGRLVYAGGPVDNPGLDVRATRRARDDVVAGLEVKGTFEAPEVTVFSEPPMMQSEALAYLLLGRPLTELSSSEGNTVSNAAMSLGIRGGNLLAQRVARRFGLDDAGIETQGSWEQASLYAGKYLSPKLYVSYGYGLFESSSLFRARYMLSRRWTLQAETGERTSTEIHYRIERGR